MKQKNKQSHKKGFLSLAILLIITLFALIMTANNKLKAQETQSKDSTTEVSQQEETKESIEVSGEETAEDNSEVELPEIEKQATKEIKPKFDPPQRDSMIYFAEPLVAEVLTGDKSLGFDDNDEPGYDSSETNDIVRSFDKVFYSFKINLDSQSKELYTDIVLKITGKVKNGVTDDGRMLNAAFSEIHGGSKDLETKSSIITYQIGGKEGSEGANTGSNRTITLPLEVFGAKNGTQLTIEDFQVQILSAKDSNGKIYDLEDADICEEIQNLKNIKVSSKIAIKPFVDRSYSYQFAPFNDVTMSSDDENANIRQLGVSVAVIPLENRGASILGSAAPTGKVSLKVSQKILKEDNVTQRPIGELELGVDTRPMKIFDYGKVDHSANYANKTELSIGYPNYTRLNNPLFVPFSEDTNQDNSVKSSGNIVMENNNDNTFDISFKDYLVDLERAPIRTKAHSVGGVYYEVYEKNFLSAGMYMFEPIEQLKEDTNLQYHFKVEEIVVEEEGETLKFKYPNTSNKSWEYKWSTVKYPKGDMATHSKYFDVNNKSLGSSDNGTYNTGDSKASKDQKIKVHSLIRNGASFFPAESDAMQKWNPKESTIVKADYMPAPNIIGTGYIKGKPLKYGVSKNGVYDLETLKKNSMDEYTWYNSISSAEKNGVVSAVSGGGIGVRTGTTAEKIIVTRVVNNAYLGTVDDKGDPFVTLSWGRMYFDKDKTKYVESPNLEKDNFRPTTYNDGNLESIQFPLGKHGDTLLIVPYSVSIGKKGYNYNTELPSTDFQSSDFVSWKLEPRIITDALGEQPEVLIKVDDELPKGMRYLEESGKVGGQTQEPMILGPDENGKTRLVWEINGVPGEKLPEITYDTYFVQSQIEFNTSGIGSLSNTVVVSSPGDNSAEVLRTASQTVNIIKEQKWEIDKTVSKPNPDYQPGNGKPEWVPGDLVESDTSDVLKYTLKVTNQTGKNIVNASILDVLPKDGEIGSLFEGKVDLKTIKILGNNKQVNPAGEAYYTENPVPRDSNPNDIAEDLFSWEDYTSELNTGSPSSKVDANAVFALIPLLKDDESAYVEITVVFKGNQPGNIYKNIANGNAENYTGVIGSRNQVTRVINRLINGRVWMDRDHSGGIDPTESLKADVPVTLYSVNAAGVKTKVKTNIRGDIFIDDGGIVLKKTDSDGKYEFDALPAGDYVVGFDLGNQITTNELYITKYEALGIIDRNNNNVPESPMEVDGTNYLTAMAKKISLPKAVNTISDGEKKDINLGVLGKPKLAAIKKVLDSSGNDIHDKKVKVGDTIRYEIEMTNTQANSVVENVKLSDTIPEGLKFVLGTLTVSVDGAPGTPIDNDRFDETGRILTTIATDTVQDLGDIVGPTGKIIVGFDVTIEKNASGKLVNVAKVSGDVVDKPKPDEKTTNEVENNTPPLPTLAKAVNVEEAKLGDVLTYTLTVGNAKGGGEWQNVVVTDNLPVYLSYVANTTKIDDVAKPDAGVWSNGKMSLTLGKIQSEEIKKITFDAKVISVPTDYQVINKVNATGQDKDDKPYAPKEAEVETPMYYRLLHVRQVILNNDETELVIPSTGYYDVSNQATVTSSTNSSNHALTSGSTTKDSGPEIVADLYTSRYIGLDKTVKGVLISDRIPEYYEYVGHIATTDKSKLAKEHLSTLLPADSQTKLAFVDYAKADEYWVTIYLQPKFGQDKNDEPEESPRPYSWSGRINDFGQLK